MDPLYLSIAFAFGFLVRLFGLPPLVGYLLAGFMLKELNVSTGSFLTIASDLGVTLLLFTIGLKLKINKLVRPEILGGATVHMTLVTGFLAMLVWGLSFSGLGLFSGFSFNLAMLIAFALSFSSTVFAVKVLEEKGDVNSLHGLISIGILIIQDLVAVIFLVGAAGKLPSLWALGLPLFLLVMRPLIFLMLKGLGHGELLVLFGFFLALVPGAELFHLVGLKPDLGALVMGMLISAHPRAKEMAESLFAFKDLFLIGFFLSIGLSGTPTFEISLVAFVLALGINIKVLLYFLVLTRFRVRARTAVHTSLALANYSEFGLIVAAISVSNGWLSEQWLITIALALSISFVISSPLNTQAHAIYARLRPWLHRFETAKRLPHDRVFDIGEAQVLVFGMGHLGTATYDHLRSRYGQTLLAFDYDEDRVKYLTAAGRNVLHDDATDSEFWERVKENHLEQVKVVFLCLNEHQSNLYALQRLKAINYTGRIAATARFDDEIEDLKRLGVDSAFNVYTEAGVGFADQVCATLSSCHFRHLEPGEDEK